jgi:hypothetical protein
MLKTEAGYRDAAVLRAHGVDLLANVPKGRPSAAGERELRRFAADGSGISCKYFRMLTGS